MYSTGIALNSKDEQTLFSPIQGEFIFPILTNGIQSTTSYNVSKHNDYYLQVLHESAKDTLFTILYELKLSEQIEFYYL